MPRKPIPTGEPLPSSPIGATLEALAATIAARREAGEGSYTYRLLTDSPDTVLKKVMEEAGEWRLPRRTSSRGRARRWRARRSNAARRRRGGGVLAVDLPAEYDAAVDHLRYEAADVVYHLLVVLERYGIDLDEFAAELNNRMTDAERPEGAVRCTRIT